MRAGVHTSAQLHDAVHIVSAVVDIKFVESVVAPVVACNIFESHISLPHEHACGGQGIYLHTSKPVQYKLPSTSERMPGDDIQY